MAMRNDVAWPTRYNPLHQMLKKIRYLPLLVRIGTTIMNTTSQGAMRRYFTWHRSYQLS
jgi:hypothetical protein